MAGTRFFFFAICRAELSGTKNISLPTSGNELQALHVMSAMPQRFAMIASQSRSGDAAPPLSRHKNYEIGNLQFKELIAAKTLVFMFFLHFFTC
jgi:hypothetical protein